MKALLNWVDQNKQLGKLLSAFSALLAVYRGLPMLAGTGLVLLSLIASACLIPLIVNSKDVPDIWLWLCLPALLLHLGIITAFIGFMMSEPLGRGYQE